jgi:hypothetical protein
MTRSVRGYALIKRGQIDAGLQELAEALDWLDRSHLGHFHWAVGFWVAEGFLRKGEVGRAREVVEEILAGSRASSRRAEGMGERLLGEALITLDPAAAGVHLDAAIGMLEQMGARNELAKALATRGELSGMAGDVAGGRALLERAVRILEELGTLDEPVRVRIVLAALRLRELGHGLLVLSRDHADLGQRLRQGLGEDPRIQIVLDRRQGERGEAGATELPDRRHADRRQRPDLDAALRAVGYVIRPEEFPP